MTNPDRVRALIHQGGPIDTPGSLRPLDQVAQALEQESADLVVLSELATSPYFPSSTTMHRDTVRRIDGEEVVRATDIAASHGCLIALSIAIGFDRGVVRNSVVLIDAAGPIPGIRVSGPRFGEFTSTFDKVHLSENNSADPGVHEKYHFAPGDGFVLWETKIGRIAPLVCYDRSFPESWRTVADAGAEVVVVPIATSRPERVRMLEAELSVAAMHNGVFVLAACKAGIEVWDGQAVTYSGGSMAIGPDGVVIARAATSDGNQVLRVVLDPEAIKGYPGTFHYARDRQPSAYATRGNTRIEQPYRRE